MAAVAITRDEHDAASLRRAAARSRDADASRRILALAFLLEGATRSDAARLPDNISLPLLPPYSPELNPVENLWQFLRQNHLSNRIYETYETIVAEPARITTIASRDWEEVRA